MNKNNILLIPLFVIILIQIFDKEDDYLYIQIIILILMILYGGYLLYKKRLNK